MIHFLLSIIVIFGPIARGSVRPWAFLILYALTAIALLIGINKLFYAKEIIIRRTPLDMPILVLLGVYVIGIFHSHYIYGSIMECTRLFILAAIFYLVINFVREEQDIKKILNIILMSGAAIAVFGILQYMGALNKEWWDNPGFLSATYVNHNHFAGLMELLAPLSIGMILIEKQMAKKVFYVYIFLILAAAFILSMSRGGWISLSISMLFMACVISRKGRARFVMLIIGLFLVTFFIFVLNTVDTGLLFKRVSSYRELDFSGRVEIWKGTLGIIKDNLFSGTGPGTFIYNFQKYRPQGLNMLVNYAHNDYLQVASETGIFGLLAMIFIIFKIIAKGLNTHRIATSSFKVWMPLALVTGVLGMAIHGVGDFNFYIPANVILFTVFSAIIFNINSMKEKGTKVIIARTALSAYRILKTILISGILVFIIFTGACLTAEIYYNASEKAVMRDDLNSAELCLKKSIIFYPLNYQFYYKLAALYGEESSAASDTALCLKKAEMEYKKALRFNDTDSWVWLGLANVYYRLYQISPLEYKFRDMAGTSYRMALKLDPANSHYMKMFGRFLLNSGEPDLSGNVYQKASDLMSKSKTLAAFSKRLTDADKYLKAADMAYSSQNIKKAMMFYKMAEQFGKKEATLGEIRCYMKISNMMKAMEKYRGLERSNKNKAVLFTAIADYCLSMGLHESAERFSEYAINADPFNPEGYQLKYRLIRIISGGYTYPEKEINKILSFNKVPIRQIDTGPGGFDVRFSVKENLYKDGTFTKEMILPAGIYEVRINAKGQKAGGMWPHMIIRFNGVDIMDAYIDKGSYDIYSGIAIVDYPVNELDILYDNDYYDPETKEDRNLYIDGIGLKSL